MINIKINKNKEFINEIIINGHSNYDEYGKDIVCASVSSIAITTVNAIIRIDNKAINYEENDGYLKIKILKHDKYIDLLLLNMLDLLTKLEKQYQKNLKIM